MSDEGIFLRYSSTSKAYRVYNHIISSLEWIHIALDDSSPQKMGRGICFDVSYVITKKLINNESSKEDPRPSIKDEDIKEDKEETLHEYDKQEALNQLPQDWTTVKAHMLDQILGDIKKV